MQTVVQKVLVGDIGGAGDQPGNINPCVLTKQNPVGINQHDAAIGGQRTQNLRGVLTAGHPVKRHRISRGLAKVCCFIAGDIKRLPVDDGFVCLLPDIERLITGLNGHITMRHLAALGQRHRTGGGAGHYQSGGHGRAVLQNGFEWGIARCAVRFHKPETSVNYH